MFKFLTNTIVLIAALAAISLAVVALVATAICFSVVLGGLTVAVHLLAPAASENTVDESVVDPFVELDSLRQFLIILFRVFSLIVKENISRLNFLTSDWAEGGAQLLAHCLEAFGSTQEMKKVVTAAIVHSWAKKD